MLKPTSSKPSYTSTGIHTYTATSSVSKLIAKTLSIIAIVIATQISCNRVVPVPPLTFEDNAYTCTCSCFIDAPGDENDTTEIIDVDVCKPVGPSTIQDCANRICPNVQILAHGVAAEAFGAATGLPGLGCTATSATCTVLEAGAPFAADGCSNPCENIQCQVLTIDKALGEACPEGFGETFVTGTKFICDNTKDCTQGEFCNDTSAVICRAPQVDPPTIKGGLMSVLFGHETTGLVASSSVATISANGETVTIPLQGRLRLNGEPCPDSSCDFGMGINLTTNDFSFDGTTLTDPVIFGGTDTYKFTINQAGAGLIPTGQMKATISAIVNGQRVGYILSNTSNIAVFVDFANKTFQTSAMFGIHETPGDLSSALVGLVTIQLSGSLANQPPDAVAGPEQTVECTSPLGAVVTLDGSGSSDPDGNLVITTWKEGVSLVGDEDASIAMVSDSLITQVQSSIGSTIYSLNVYDSKFQGDTDYVAVEVQDTTGPIIQDIDINLDCLWPPNHKLVSFELGKDIKVDATDTCQDGDPSIRIINVTSSEPDNGTGDGDTAGDISFGEDGVCVRAERAGILQERVYTVEIEATDQFGNTSTQTATIVVPRGKVNDRCRVPAPRFVEDGDPACSFTSPSQSSTALDVEPEELLSVQKGQAPSSAEDAPEDSLAVEEAGCSATGSSASTPVLLLFGLFFFGLLLRRGRLPK